MLNTVHFSYSQEYPIRFSNIQETRPGTGSGDGMGDVW